MNDIENIIGGALNPQNYDTADQFAPLPDGEYPVWIESAEIGITKKQDGKYVKVKVKVMEGPFERRSLFHYFNIQNPNQTAEDIGRRQLAQLSEALGLVLSDTAQLIDKAVIVRVKKKDDENEIQAWKPYGQTGGTSRATPTPQQAHQGPPAQPQYQQQQPQPPQQPAQQPKMPWQR